MLPLIAATQCRNQQAAIQKSSSWWLAPSSGKSFSHRGFQVKLVIVHAEAEWFFGRRLQHVIHGRSLTSTPST